MCKWFRHDVSITRFILVVLSHIVITMVNAVIYKLSRKTGKLVHGNTSAYGGVSCSIFDGEAICIDPVPKTEQISQLERISRPKTKREIVSLSLRPGPSLPVVLTDGTENEE